MAGLPRKSRVLRTSNGLKFRMPGLGGQALGNMGASVQNLPGAEVYQALASGAIDGTEWIGPWADEKGRFPGNHQVLLHRWLCTNRRAALSLVPPTCDVLGEPEHRSIRSINRDCSRCQRTNVWNLSTVHEQQWCGALQRLQAGGVKVLEFPDERLGCDGYGASYRKSMDQYNGRRHLRPKCVPAIT